MAKASNYTTAGSQNSSPDTPLTSGSEAIQRTMREIGVAFSGNIINTPSAPPAAPPRWYNKLLKFVVEYGYLCIAGLWFLIIGWQIASSIGTSVKQGSYKYKISQGDNTYYADSYRVQNHCAFMNVLSSGNNNFTGQAALCGNYKIKEQH